MGIDDNHQKEVVLFKCLITKLCTYDSNNKQSNNKHKKHA